MILTAKISYDYLSRIEVSQLAKDHGLRFCVAPNRYGSGPGKALLLRSTDYATGQIVRQDWRRIEVTENDFWRHLEEHHLAVAHPKTARRPEFVKVVWQPEYRAYLVAAGMLKRKRTRKDASLWRLRRKYPGGRHPPT